MAKKKTYVPSRGDIILIDFEPAIGKEMGKYRPALVLSPKDYNEASKLLICCPISTSIRGTPTEVPVKRLKEPSVVASNMIQTMSWQDRNMKFVMKSEKKVIENVLIRFLPFIGVNP